MTPPESTDKKVTAITVAPSTQSIAIGGTTQLSATITPTDATNQNIKWSSKQEAIATAPTLGTLTVGVTPGADGYSVTVTPNVEAGNTRYYRVTAANAAPTITYDQRVTTSEWTAFAAGQKVTGTSGQVISVVDLTAGGKARKYGKAVLPAQSA